MATGGDPVSCTCKTNACTRVKGRHGENTRGYCQCRQNGTACTYLCRCGQGRYSCVNTQHIEEEEDDCVKDSDEDPLFECDEQECDEVLSVYYGDEEVSVNASNTLNTSLQDVATEQAELNASMMVDDDDQSPVQRQTKARRKKTAKVDKVAVQRSTGGCSTQNSAKARRKAAAKEVTSKVSRLSNDSLQILVLKMAELYPDLVDMAMGPDPPGPPHETPQGGWCKCDNCREMPTTTEEVCCIKSEDEQCTLISDAGPINQLVLSRQALEVAILNHNEYCIQNDDPSNNDALRHMAYRKFVLWRRGYLGSGHRVVIPSCVVWAIRDRYPSADGTYTGFKFSLMY